MNLTIYESVLKDEMRDFTKLRSSQGFKDTNRYVLATFDKYLLTMGTCAKEITAEIVDGWLSACCAERNTRTIDGYITYYNAFAKYLKSIGITAFLPEHPLLDQNYMPYIFSAQEIENIFRIADSGETIKNKLAQLQVPMLLRILYGCGLRIGEALTLKLADVDFTDGILYIWNGKGKKDRLVPMDETLTEILKMYCDTVLAGKPADSYLFESDYNYGKRNAIGRPRPNEWVKNHFRRVIQAAGIEFERHSAHERGICPHCLRHTFAVNSFRNQDLMGIDNYRNSPLLSTYLGHRKLNDTQKYLHMTAESAQDMIALTTEYSSGLFPEVPK